ncbi:MAG: transposase [Frankiales bacterium]|nr:transposase [Frankiales bacterium]
MALPARLACLLGPDHRRRLASFRQAGRPEVAPPTFDRRPVPIEGALLRVGYGSRVRREGRCLFTQRAREPGSTDLPDAAPPPARSPLPAQECVDQGPEPDPLVRTPLLRRRSSRRGVPQCLPHTRRSSGVARLSGIGPLRRCTTTSSSAGSSRTTWRRQPRTGTVVRSDRGSVYISWVFGHRLREAGLLGSMGRVARSVDNSMIVSFWSTLQRELLDTRPGRPRTSSRARSSSGSRLGITPAAGTPASACSAPSSSQPFTPPRSLRHDHHAQHVRRTGSCSVPSYSRSDRPVPALTPSAETFCTSRVRYLVLHVPSLAGFRLDAAQSATRGRCCTSTA